MNDNLHTYCRNKNQFVKFLSVLFNQTKNSSIPEKATVSMTITIPNVKTPISIHHIACSHDLVVPPPGFVFTLHSSAPSNTMSVFQPPWCMSSKNWGKVLSTYALESSKAAIPSEEIKVQDREWLNYKLHCTCTSPTQKDMKKHFKGRDPNFEVPIMSG